MTDTYKREDWIRFFKASTESYKLNALCAVYENDGIKMLHGVLKSLSLEKTEDLVKLIARTK